MHKDKLQNPLKVEEAILEIEKNNAIGYQWYTVKNKKGCIFELGGRNKESLELMVYIPHYNDDGTVQLLSNGYTNSNYSLNACEVSFPDKRATFPSPLDHKAFKALIQNTDFRTTPFEIKTSVIYSEPVYHHEIIMKKNAKENKS